MGRKFFGVVETLAWRARGRSPAPAKSQFSTHFPWFFAVRDEQFCMTMPFSRKIVNGWSAKRSTSSIVRQLPDNLWLTKPKIVVFYSLKMCILIIEWILLLDSFMLNLVNIYTFSRVGYWSHRSLWGHLDLFFSDLNHFCFFFIEFLQCILLQSLKVLFLSVTRLTGMDKRVWKVRNQLNSCLTY